jgi:type I restriction enzyme S subunit
VTAMRRVGDVAEQIRGVTYAKGDVYDRPTPGAVPVLRAGNIQDGGLLLDDDLVYVLQDRISPEQYLRPGDVVVATSSGSLDVVGKAGRVELEMRASFGAFCKVLRPSPDVDSRYFAHWFSTPGYRRRVSNLAAGANINNLRNEHLDDLDIPVPSMAEQVRIADLLDKADAIRRKRKAAIALADDLLPSTFLDMFGDPVSNPKGWPVLTLDDVVEDFQYGTSAKCSTVETDGALPVLRIPNVNSGDIDWADLKYTQLSAVEQDRWVLTPGDLLVVRSNGNPEMIGRCAPFEGPRRAAFASYLIRMRVAGDVGLARYVCDALAQARYRECLAAAARTTAGNFNISVDSLRRLPMPMPSEPLIRVYGERVKRVRALRAQLAAADRRADALMAGAVSAAFRDSAWIS